MYNAKEEIAKIFASKVWPLKPDYSYGLIVSEERSRYLRIIEEELYQLVQSKYPDVKFDRTINVLGSFRYEISIKVNESMRGTKPL